MFLFSWGKMKNVSTMSHGWENAKSFDLCFLWSIWANMSSCRSSNLHTRASFPSGRCETDMYVARLAYYLYIYIYIYRHIICILYFVFLHEQLFIFEFICIFFCIIFALYFFALYLQFFIYSNLVFLHDQFFLGIFVLPYFFAWKVSYL